MDRPARILVVDDDTSICRTLGLIFERQGYETELNRQGAQEADGVSWAPSP